MCDKGCEHRGLVNVVEALTCDKVKAVNICGIVGDNKACTGILYVNNGFEKVALSILDILTKRVKIGRENYRSILYI